MKEFNLLSKLLLIWSLIYLNSTVLGQIEINETYPYTIFEEIGNSRNIAYTYNHEPKIYDKQYLTTFSPDGKQLSKIEIEAKQGSNLLDCISVGTNTVFYFDLNYSTDLVLLVVDKMGKEVTRKTLPYLKIFGTDIIPVGNDKFYLCAGIKDKKQGISVECFNLNLESQWVYSKLPEKSRYFYTDAIVNSRGDIALIYNEKSVDDRILFLDASGNELADTLINVGEMDEYTPYKMHFKTADELLIFADYGTFNKESFMTTPIGLNIKHVTLKGEEIGNQTLLFETIQKQYGNKDSFGKPVNEPTPSLRIVDIQTINGKTSLIAESYYFSQRVETINANPPAQPTTEVYKNIALLDLYLLDLENLETAVWRFWKPARTLSLKGIKFYDATDLCDLLEEKSLFSYQGIFDNEILIRGFSQNHEYFNRIPLNMHWEDVSTRTYFGLPLSDNYYSREYVQNFNLGSGFSPIPGMRLSGFFHFENHLTFYRFHKPTGNLQFTIIK